MNDERQSKGRLIGFRVSPDLAAQIEAVASAREWTLAHAARSLVVQGLARPQQPQEAA
jgi:hypothetical protein